MKWNDFWVFIWETIQSTLLMLPELKIAIQSKSDVIIWKSTTVYEF